MNKMKFTKKYNNKTEYQEDLNYLLKYISSGEGSEVFSDELDSYENENVLISGFHNQLLISISSSDEIEFNFLEKELKKVANSRYE